MAATMAPNGHIVTQSEQFFGGVQLQISIDHNIKNTWVCPSCGCSNMGKSNSCGLCGLLNPKYTIKARDMHKKSMVTKERIKLLTSKDIFKKVSTQFPQFSKYSTTTTPSNKRRKSQKSQRENLIDSLDLLTTTNRETFSFPINASQPPQADTISFVENVFSNINFEDMFGVETEAPVIIDDDEEDPDPPLSPISDADDNDELTFLSFNDRMNSTQTYTLRGNKLPDMTPKHVRQVSFSAPTTPHRHKHAQRDRLQINKNVAPLLMGVIHTPAPSKENRLNIVMSNVENIVKCQFDGCFFINHGYSPQQLVPIIHIVHKKYPTLWLGANFMGIAETKMFKFVKTNKLHKILGGVWCENSGIRLAEDELEDIFVHNFYKLTPRVFKEEIEDNYNCKLAMAKKHSNGSNTSIKSNHSGKKRVTFSALSNALMNGDSNTVTMSVDTPSNNTPKKPPVKLANHRKYGKKDDSFARHRLNGINKYQFDGLYFGGVDLKQGKCIKIPTQKSIRTRRRTYSAQSVDVIGLLPNGTKSSSPRTASPARKCDTPQTYSYKYKQQKGFTAFNLSRNGRSKSQHSGSPKKTSTKNRNKNMRNSLKLRKSLSTQIISDDETVLATISSEDEPKKLEKMSKSHSLTKKHRNIPKSITTKPVIHPTAERHNVIHPHSTVGYQYHITPKWKSKKHKKHPSKHKNTHKTSKNHKNHKKIYSMTDSEIDTDIEAAIDAFFSSTSLKVANSLDINDVAPKSPITPNDDDDDNESNPSPPPLPKSPSTPTLNLSRNNIKLHNMALHRPLDSHSTDGLALNRHSHSMPHDLPLRDHDTQTTQETRSSSASYSEGDLDATSVYSHTSQVSEAWSDYGSVNETMDDYFEAMSSLGKLASKGYMDVITTSGKGKNIDIKLKALKEACHKKCLLAVASGVRTENVETFLPYVDILMVSTCISRDFHLFDAKKMVKFKRTVDDYFAAGRIK